MTMIAFLPPISSVTRLTARAASTFDLAPDLVRAGEGDPRHVGVLDQRHAHLGAAADHQIQRARRQPRVGERLDEVQRRVRRVGRRLEDDGVAGDQRGP